MSSDESFGAPNIPVGNLADDLCDLTHGEIDFHNGPSLRDMNVRWGMIEGVNPDFEPLVANERGH